MSGGSVTGYLFSDFDFQNDAGQLHTSQTNPGGLPFGATAELSIGAQTVDINIDDDDTLFDDGFQDAPDAAELNQFLRDPIDTTDANGTQVSIAAGSTVEVEFTLIAVPQGGGPSIELLFVSAGPGENMGELSMVVSTAPLTPGVVYNIYYSHDGGGASYSNIVCFARGTLIRTPDGDMPVEALRIGDLVETAENGARPIVWMSQRALLFPARQLQPVRIPAGAMGPACPFRDTYLSPLHCVVLRHPVCELLFDTPTVMSSAQNLVEGGLAEQHGDTRIVEYYHFMLPAHEGVLANGMETESFFPGPVARRGLDAGALTRLCALYPSLGDDNAAAPFPRAHLRIGAHETRVALHYLRDAATERLTRQALA